MAERRDRLRLAANRPLRAQKRQQVVERKKIAEEVSRQTLAQAKLEQHQQRPRNDNCRIGVVVVAASSCLSKSVAMISAQRPLQSC
jgi:hypothetical protein